MSSKGLKMHLRDRRLYTNAGMEFPRCYNVGGPLDTDKGRLPTTGLLVEVTCRRCLALSKHDDTGVPPIPWIDRIFIVTPTLHFLMQSQGWCISLSDRYGWQVERDDEAALLKDDVDALALAVQAGVPVNHRGQLTKYPIHFSQLEDYR